jgi:hypothetical protein
MIVGTVTTISGSSSWNSNFGTLYCSSKIYISLTTGPEVSPSTITVISAATVTYTTAAIAGSVPDTSNSTASNNKSLSSGATAGVVIGIAAAIHGLGLHFGI